jgi:hypothetical protein
VVKLAIDLGCGPLLPAIIRVEDGGVVLALKLRIVLSLSLQLVEVLQEQQPRRLLGLVQLRGKPLVVPEYFVDIVERVLKHAALILVFGKRILRGGEPQFRSQIECHVLRRARA